MGTMLPTGGVWAAGSDKPELEEGEDRFHPADRLFVGGDGFGDGLRQEVRHQDHPSKEASWAGVRDKLVQRRAPCRSRAVRLVYGVHLGIGGPKKDMAVLMTINNNGQAITLSNGLRTRVRWMAPPGQGSSKKEKEYTFAQTFPTGTHAMWLYYWLAAHGIDPFRGREEHRRAAAADGRQHARRQHGRLLRRRTVEPTCHRRQDRLHRGDLPGHLDRPSREGAGTTADFATQYPNTARAMICAILEASGGSMPAPPTAARPPNGGCQSYVNTDVDVIRSRMIGQYENGLGKSWSDKNFHEVLQRRRGELSLPLGRHVVPHPAPRWGLAQAGRGLPRHRQGDQPDRALQTGRQHRRAGAQVRLRSSKLIDGVVWDGKDPKKYAASFKIKA